MFLYVSSNPADVLEILRGAGTKSACDSSLGACDTATMLEIYNGAGTNAAWKCCEKHSRKKTQKGAQQNACRLDFRRQPSQNVFRKTPDSAPKLSQFSHLLTTLRYDGLLGSQAYPSDTKDSKCSPGDTNTVPAGTKIQPSSD